jgi:hypothetical protein
VEPSERHGEDTGNKAALTSPGCERPFQGVLAAEHAVRIKAEERFWKSSA